MEAKNNSVTFCLTPEMKHGFYQTNDKEIDIIYFPGGEPHVKIDKGSSKFIGSVEHVYVSSRLESPEHVITLLVAVDAFKRYYPNAEIVAYLPYIPGARQDRAYNGEALTVKVYADLLNNSGIDRIITLDPHSEVQTALLDTKLLTVPGLDIADLAYRRIATNHGKDPLIVFPDTGAKKKYVSQLRPNTYISIGKEKRAASNKPWYITADKLRDTQTGKISGFKVLDNYKFDPEEPILIVDDICDGGGTFIGLGKELKKLGVKNLYLYITHGIFSKGLFDLDEIFNLVFTTNSFDQTAHLEPKKLVILNY